MTVSSPTVREGFVDYDARVVPDRVLANFITFRTYGNRVHGDGRGSMDRSGSHGYGAPVLAPNTRREA
jgi:hypothetical protein